MPSLSSGYRAGTSEKAKRHERMRKAMLAEMEERKADPGPSPWQVTVAAVKADETCRLLAKAIRDHNLTHSAPDRTAYGAFRDRVDEMGLYVPNEAYYGVLLLSAMA